MLSDKNILITPNIGSAVADPKIEFTGADAGSNVTITATMYADGTLSFDSSLGQLFSISSVASGTIFSVADISGMPIIEADSDGSVRMAEFFGDVSIGTSTSVEKLTVEGNVQAVRFVSTQSTGTAPFTVSSTTLVTNLNADLLDGQQGSYYLDWTNITSKPDPTIAVTLTGDVTGTGSVVVTDLATATHTVTFATTIAANSVALGTDTTGNYIATIAGTTNQINVSGSGSETAAVTLSTPQDIHTAATPTFSRLTLSQTTGTAPLTVSSTTVVTNLNADLLDAYQASDFPRKTENAAVSGHWVFSGSGLTWSSHSYCNLFNPGVDNSVYIHSYTSGWAGGTTQFVWRSWDGVSAPKALTWNGSGNLHADGGLVWTANNDGAGSTLDADLLDGQQGSYYLDWTNITGKPDPTIAVTLTGDVTGTGSVVVTDLATATHTVTFATTIAANSVALGTDTTGNYVATIAGTTNQITVSGSGSETAAVTLSTPQDIHTAATPTFSRLTLSQTTGTAPMTVSSTTVVTNLNADLLDGQQGSYYQDWTNVTNKPDPTIAVTLTGDVTGTGSVTVTDLATATHTITFATALAAGIIATADIANDAVDNTKLANMAAATVKGRAVGAGTGDPTDLTAAQLVTIIATADGTGSTLDADLLDSYEATAFPRKAETATITGDWTFSNAVTNNGVDTASQLSGFSVLPRGYLYSGMNFRFDQSQTAWLFRQNNLTYTITAGTDPGASAVRQLFDWTNNYINLNTYKNVSNTWGVEVTGFSLSNSSNTIWRPYVMWHSANQGSVLIEFRAGDNATWSTAYNGTSNAYTLPTSSTTIAPGVLTGIRFTFSGITGNAYVKMLGAMSTTSDSFAWQMLKGGGDFYGTVSWKDLGTTYASITSVGVADFASLTTTGTIVGSSTVQGTRFISTQSTGTAPLTVSSTTVVTNLNADLLDGQQGSYYLDAANLTGTVAFARLDAANDTGGEFPISDRRALGDVSPDSYRDKAVTFSFSDDYPTLGSWGSAITMKGWSDGYYAWQIVSYSSTGADSAKENLFFRTGVSSAWNTIRKVWDSGNDGASSGLDADLLDGQQGSYYLDWANITSKPDPQIGVTLAGDVSGTGSVTVTDLGAGPWTITIASSAIGTGTVTNAKLADMAQNTVKGRISSGTGDPEDLTATQLIDIIETADGAGSGLDADLLDGQQGTHYHNDTRGDARYAIISDSAPGSPFSGMRWYDSSTGRLAVWTGAEWVEVGSKGSYPISGVPVYIQDSQPADPVYVWFDTSGGNVQMWIEDGI